MVVVLSLLVSPVSAWPTEEQWNVVVNESGNLTDPIADYSGQTDVQIIGNDSYPSAYMFNNGTNFSFRLRVLGEPLKTPSLNYFFQGSNWGVEFDTDGNTSNYEYILSFSGGNNQQKIEFWKNDHGGSTGYPGDAAGILLWSIAPVPNSNWTYFRAVEAPKVWGVDSHFVDFRMPYDIFQNFTNVTNESSMRLIFGTSASNGNLAGDIAASSLDGTAVTVADSVSAPVSPTGTMLTNGSVAFVADISGSGDVTSINVTDMVYVKVNDSDRNTNALSNQSLNVTLNTSTGDLENLTLTETGIDTGIFTGNISTNDASFVQNDYTLQVIEGGSFNVTYNDTTADGVYILRIDNATVNDTTPPTISYNPTTTENNSELNITNSIIINFTAYDLYLKNVSVNLYNSTGSLLNSSVFPCSPCTTYTDYITFNDRPNGVYLFNVTAYDTSGNSNTTLTRTVTVNLTSGIDLQLTSQNITFVYDSGETAEVTEAGEARENINLTIDATVYNQGSSASGTFYVLFYDGDDSSEFYNVSMNSIAGSSSANATAYWTTLAGTHNITVKVDPAADSSDTDFSNNNASKLINVSAWQKYYGNATGNRMLANSLATSMNNWTWDNETNIGYLYVVNTSASINWSALHPLGYDSDNTVNATGQDFQDADTNLGMVVGTDNATGFGNNNITDLFTNTSGSNYGNIAIDKTSFVIFGNTINNVPIVNATDMTNHNAVGSANFVTGVLWDDTKDSNGYYDTTDNEDLIFITKIQTAALGLKGSYHNYEIAVPHTLNSITSGDVDIYMELI